MSAHTPGPVWTLGPGRALERDGVVVGNLTRAVDPVTHASPMAPWEFDALAHDVVNALNAAPDMLEALRMLVDIGRRSDRVANLEDITRANAILAKVEGGQS